MTRLADEMKAAVSSKFDLKNHIIEPTRARRTTANVALADLEAFRVSRHALSASKNALELICGASCETGAQ